MNSTHIPYHHRHVVSLRGTLVLLALIVVLAALLGGCGGGGGTSTPPATYTISGTITDNGAGVAGIAVAVGGAQADSTITDATGAYSISGLAAGTYTITPTSAIHSFTPASLSLTITNADKPGQNFTASLQPAPVGSYTVSGRITLNGNGLAGIAVGIGGAQSAQTATDGNGNYSFSGLTAGTYTITPTSGSYDFNATHITLNNIAGNMLNQNFTATQKLGSITITF